jgi:hypothetical protein
MPLSGLTTRTFRVQKHSPHRPQKCGNCPIWTFRVQKNYPPAPHTAERTLRVRFLLPPNTAQAELKLKIERFSLDLSRTKS